MVKEIIDQYAMYDVEYGPGYTNHLPMALVALERIGANGKTLENFAKHYVERLNLLTESTVTDDKDNWENFLGTHKHYASYVHFFQKEAEKLGVEGLMKRY